MEAIISKATRERKGRTTFMTAVLVGFAVFFHYDAFVGYPAKNVAAARDALNPRPDELPGVDPAITNALKGTIRPGDAIEAVIGQLGPPGWKNDGEYRWFGPNGSLRVGADSLAVREVEWLPGKFDTVAQIWIGTIVAVLAVPMLLRLIRVWRFRVILDDTGLKIGKRLTIPFEAMARIDADRYKQKGWVTLDYTAGDRSRSVKLDCDAIDKFRQIINAICTHKGWPDPLPRPRSDDE